MVLGTEYSRVGQGGVEQSETEQKEYMPLSKYSGCKNETN